MAEPKIETKSEPMPEGAPFLIIFMGADGGLKFSARGVGSYAALGWMLIMILKLGNQLIGEKK